LRGGDRRTGLREFGRSRCSSGAAVFSQESSSFAVFNPVAELASGGKTLGTSGKTGTC